MHGIIIYIISVFRGFYRSMFILFFAVWMLLNGRFNLETVLFGVVISGLLYWFCCRFVHYSFQKDMWHIRRLGKLIKIFLVLVVEIVKACLAVLPYVYGRGTKPEPVIAHFTTDRVSTPAGRVILANCITMTPGTITGSLNQNGDYLVHCLDRSMALGLDSSDFVDAIHKWEEG